MASREPCVWRHEQKQGAFMKLMLFAGVLFATPDRRIAWNTPVQPNMVTLKPDQLKQLTAEAATERRVEAIPGAVTLDVGGGRVKVRRMDGRGEQHIYEALASRTIEGVAADGHRTTTTIAAGAIGNDLPIVITSEEWTSPD